MARRFRHRERLGGASRKTRGREGRRRALADARGALAMTTPIQFDQVRLAPEIQALRAEVRAFLQKEIAAGTFDPRVADRESGYNPAFSRRMGERGWIGMTWPKR